MAKKNTLGNDWVADYFVPEGKTFDKKMESLMDRRAAWWTHRNMKGDCIILVNKADEGTIGYWLGQKGITHAVLDKGGPLRGSVMFTDAMPAEP